MRSFSASLVLAAFVVLKIIRVVRGSSRVIPVYRTPVVPSEPEKPRMWEVSLCDARAPSLSSKWGDLMVCLSLVSGSVQVYTTD